MQGQETSGKPSRPNEIQYGDNLTLLRELESASCNLIYIDPPFNTGRVQKRDRVLAQKSESGARGGFGGALYNVQKLASPSYQDTFNDFLGFLEPRLQEAYRVLAEDGSFFLHIDYREVHYVKVMLDQIFGRECFLNELIWAYDYGGKPKNRWPAKHDNLLWYVKNPDRYTFNYDAIDRIPYMAPDLVGPEKAALGKVPTDVWWMTIVPTNSREKNGLSDAEAAETAQQNHAGTFEAGRCRARLFRRQRNHRGGRRAEPAKFYPDGP